MFDVSTFFSQSVAPVGRIMTFVVGVLPNPNKQTNWTVRWAI